MPRKVSDSDALNDGDILRTHVDGTAIMITRTDRGLRALRDACPHLELPLSDGKIKDDKITCRHHGVQVDLHTGKVAFGMGFSDLSPVVVYKVREENGEILIDL